MLENKAGMKLGKRKIFALDDKMPFGKYAGWKFRTIAEQHPKYIQWLNDETEVEMEEAVLELADSNLNIADDTNYEEWLGWESSFPEHF